MDKQIMNKIGGYWGHAAAGERKIRWMNHPLIASIINHRIAGIENSDWGMGMHHLLRKQYLDRLPFQRGISVACGPGRREMQMMEMGLVDRFDCYEFSSERIALGQKRAKRAGLSKRITFHEADAFAAPIADGSFDLVVWSNALHHMMDVPNALVWSRRILRPGGVMFIDDYVGPSRFQYSDETLEIVNRVRGTLPVDIFRATEKSEKAAPRLITRIKPEELIAVDPSEAADSERTLEAVKNIFPEAEIIPISSSILILAYHRIAHQLNKIYHPHIKMAAIIDEMLLQSGSIYWAGVLAEVKS